MSILAMSLGAAPAGERDQLNACRAMVAQSQQAGTAQDAPALAKCRQVIKEWTLRDSRRSVDEDGRPLR
ncbi:MAG TPA: hypothetical protein VGH70_15795 [Bradyrhizobium sp.]